MSDIEFDYLSEGETDDAIARKLLLHCGHKVGMNRRTPTSGSGKSNLDRRLKGLNAGLPFSGNPLLVLRDLDDDAECPGQLVAKLIAVRHSRCVVRICVRSADAWLMADRRRYAKYCGLPENLLPRAIDEIRNPKQLIFSWAKANPKSKLARFLTSRERLTVPKWAALAEFNILFVETSWNIDDAHAGGCSNSLNRAIISIRSVA